MWVNVYTKERHKSNMNKVSISLFAGDYLEMGKSMEQIISSGADEIHIDIMDGQFVPLFGFNDMWLRSAAQKYKVSYDLHFMTYITDEMLLNFSDLPVNTIWLHIESAKDEMLKNTFETIKKNGISRGLAISPQTDFKTVEPYLPLLDNILVLCCEPGTKGAQFLDSSYVKIKELKSMIDKTGYCISLSVDGGVDRERAKKCIQNGSNELIIGRSFFACDNKKRLVEDIRSFI